MALIPGLALLLLGLAVGFIIAWALGIFSTGISAGLLIGVLLLVAGAIVGFVSEWWIDEAYRKNRELQRQLREAGIVNPPIIQLAIPERLAEGEQEAAALRLNSGATNNHSSSELLTDFLRQRDEELREVRQQVVSTDAQINTLRKEFEAYRRTHPDNLMLIQGIGRVFQWKLRDAGIHTYEQLAAADPNQLRRLLGVKKWQRVNIESWVEQARDWAQRGP